jgi:hypothetical protein
MEEQKAKGRSRGQNSKEKSQHTHSSNFGSLDSTIFGKLEGSQVIGPRLVEYDNLAGHVDGMLELVKGLDDDEGGREIGANGAYLKKKD